jgi:2-polyprenyl-6-methoxyphenol hydroxylase-like FAD-dependent oxidoreductase
MTTEDHCSWFIQADLRWRLRSVYDRQEVNDLLRHLQEEGFIKIRFDPRVVRVERDGAVVTALDDKEEKTAFWFVGDGRRHWYVV